MNTEPEYTANEDLLRCPMCNGLFECEEKHIDIKVDGEYLEFVEFELICPFCGYKTEWYGE